MTSKDSMEIRYRLVRTAGRLFAENGYEATTLQSIAEAEGMTVEKINYWIGNKDHLYASVFMMLLEEDRRHGIESIIKEHPEWKETPFGQAQIIRRKIQMMFNALRNEELPWKAAFIARELATRLLSKENQAEHIAQVLTDDLYHFCREIKDDLTEDELEIVCRCFPLSQIGSFLMLASRECKDYASLRLDPIRFDNLIWFTTATILGYMGLPAQELLP